MPGGLLPHLARTRYWRVYTSVCLASVKCLCARGHNTMITPGLEPGPHGPEFSCNPLNHRVPHYIKHAKEKQLNFPTTKNSTNLFYSGDKILFQCSLSQSRTPNVQEILLTKMTKAPRNR